MRVICIPKQHLTRLYKALFIVSAMAGAFAFSSYKLYTAEKEDNSHFYEEIADKDSEIEQLKSELKKKQIEFDLITKVSDSIRRYNSKVSKLEALRIAHAEIKYAEKYQVPLHFGLAISAKESTFISSATSYNNTSHGLKQIHRAVWAKNLSVNELKDLHYNTSLGYKILKEYKITTGNYASAFKRYYGSTNPEENTKYSNDVMRLATRFEKELS